MEITDLPPGPAPAPLTARHAAANLAEHLAGFRAVNGFAPDDLEHPAMLFLRALSEEPGTSLIKFKRDAYRLKDLAKKQIKLGNIHQLMAAAYGYKTLAALQAAADGDGNVKNISE